MHNSKLHLEKAIATHSSILAWRIPGTEEGWEVAVYGVAQSRTQQKRLGGSSSIEAHFLHFLYPSLC